MSTVLTTPSGTADAEPGRTLADEQPRTLGVADHFALWANLGVSLLGPAYAFYVLEPGTHRLSLVAAFTAIVVGSVIGTIPVGFAALAGARSGAPAMVLLRGLFGRRLSYLPTVLNLLQCMGWGVFEIVVIADAADQLLPWKIHWLYVLLAGALTTTLTLRPLGFVRTLRRYALVAVAASTVYFLVQFLRAPLPSLTHGTWSGFWTAADGVMAVSISFVPLAADYTRHSRSGRGAFAGSVIGYSVTQIVYYALGLLAFSTVVHGYSGDNGPVFAAFIALPLGWLPFAVLVLRELDESFANVYSTTVSIQNLRPLADRRVLAVLIGVLATAGALVLHLGADYQNFLLLIGSIFVPLAAVFTVDYFVLRRREWDVSARAPARWPMLVPWLLGFVVYQLINPGDLGWWTRQWTNVATWLHFTARSWMSASLLSFAVAALATVPFGLLDGAHRRRRADRSGGRGGAGGAAAGGGAGEHDHQPRAAAAGQPAHRP
ncbi:purine-cytosine permease family protein [uncultured Jatrophihabitans sp.]|uniref:purine-cytosine permease family protein n=1 Tax=uncultured Jatrophihabitans sp. TaxID=1610747 RepID=UPI0035CBEBE9